MVCGCPGVSLPLLNVARTWTWEQRGPGPGGVPCALLTRPEIAQMGAPRLLSHCTGPLSTPEFTPEGGQGWAMWTQTHIQIHSGVRLGWTCTFRGACASTDMHTHTHSVTHAWSPTPWHCGRAHPALTSAQAGPGSPLIRCRTLRPRPRHHASLQGWGSSRLWGHLVSSCPLPVGFPCFF